MRHVILDTETTGLSHEQGHRIIEIAAVELIDRKLTKNHFHCYLNPLREVDEGAFRIHGISTAFLQDKPFFNDVVEEFVQFIDGAELIIHNAAFDVGFINAELKLIQWGKDLEHYCQVTDTLALARAKHPGQRNTLDALCKRYDIDNSNRQLHGALVDAELLGLVYLAMTGGQSNLFTEENVDSIAINTVQAEAKLSLANPVVIKASAEELASHQAFIAMLASKSSVNYWEDEIIPILEECP